jgi:hypothetical protein
VAAGLAGAGLPEQAANVAGQAVQAAAGVEDRWRAYALSATAAALAGAGLAEQTWAVVDTAANVEDPRQQAEALSKVAEALVKAGLAEQAVRAAAGIDDPKRRASALSALLTNSTVRGSSEHEICRRALKLLLLTWNAADYLAAYPEGLLRRLVASGEIEAAEPQPTDLAEG